MWLVDTTTRLADTTMRLPDTTIRLADTTPHYLDVIRYTQHLHTLHPRNLAQIILSVFYILIYIYFLKHCIYNLILYICKLVLMLFVIYPSKKPP